MQWQLERAESEEPVGQRADDAGLQREGDERRHAEGLVAHGVEVGAVLSVVYQVVLTINTRTVDANVGRLASALADCR